MAPPVRLERTTNWLTASCSTTLSYGGFKVFTISPIGRYKNNLAQLNKISHLDLMS